MAHPHLKCQSVPNGFVKPIIFQWPTQLCDCWNSHRLAWIELKFSPDRLRFLETNRILMGSRCGTSSGVRVPRSYLQLPWSYLLIPSFCTQAFTCPHIRPLHSVALPQDLFLLFPLYLLPQAFYCLQPFAAGPRHPQILLSSHSDEGFRIKAFLLTSWKQCV